MKKQPEKTKPVKPTKEKKIRVPRLPLPENQRTRRQVSEMIGDNEEWKQQFAKLCALCRAEADLPTRPYEGPPAWELSFLERMSNFQAGLDAVANLSLTASYEQAERVFNAVANGQEMHVRKTFRLRAELHGQEMRFFLVN